MTIQTHHLLLAMSILAVACSRSTADGRRRPDPIVTPASAAAPCPAGASWVGLAPPFGDGYQCAVQGSDGSFVRHGWAVEYFANGNKQEECEYETGKRHGRCTFFHDDGSKSERGYYEEGKRVGDWVTWPSPENRAAAELAAARLRVETDAAEAAALEQAERDTQQARRDSVSEEETANKKCDQVRFDALVRNAALVTQTVKRRMSVLDQKIEPLSDEALEVSFQAFVPGRYLVYVWAFSGFNLAVTDESGNVFTEKYGLPIGERAPFGDGRRLTLGQQQANVSLSGRGCALLMVLREFD